VQLADDRLDVRHAFVFPFARHDTGQSVKETGGRERLDRERDRQREREREREGEEERSQGMVK
jgi:hypothetical protein